MIIQTQPAQAWPGARVLLGLYLLFLSVYLLTASGHFWSTDHVSVYNTTQSLVERGDLAVKPINDTILGRDGRSYYSVHGLGQSVLSVPLYLVGKAVDTLASPALRQYFGGPQLRDFGGTVPIFFVSLFNQLLAPLICLLVYLFCLRLGFPRTVALLTTLVVGFATPVWVGAREYFQHPLETLLLLACVYVLFAHRQSLGPRQALLAGGLLALGVLTRINLLLVAPAVALYLFALVAPAGPGGWAGLRPRALAARLSPATLITLLAFAAPMVVALAAIMGANYGKFGEALNFQPMRMGYAYRLANLPTGLFGNLFSPGRSLFLYAPPTILALFTYREFYRRWRAEALLFAAVAAIYLLSYSAYDEWPGGWSWGPRFLLATVPLLVIPLGYFLTSRARLALVALVTCLGVVVQVLGVTVNVSYVYYAWEPLNLKPSNAFLFVPSLSAVPAHLGNLLAGRYVDLWLGWVFQSFGWGVFLATLAVPLLLLGSAVRLLRAAAEAEVPTSLGGERLPGGWQGQLGGAVVGDGWAKAWAVVRTAPRRVLANHGGYLAGLAFLTLLAGLPLLQLKWLSGHDAGVYVPRAVEFFEGLRAGQLPPRWAPDFNAGYGEPSFNYIPPLLLYLSARFHVLGFGFVAAEDLACLTLLLLAGLGMYALANRFAGPRGGLVAAAAYLFAPYLQVVLYVRHALLDFSAFAFLPFALLGIYAFATGGRRRYLFLGSIAAALLLLSSNTVALIAFPFFLLLVCWLAWAGRSRQVLARGFLCLALGMGLSAFFWLPALAERDYTHIGRVLEGYLNYRNHFVYPLQFLWSPWGYGLSVAGPGDGMSFALGPPHLVLAGVAVAVALRWPRRLPGARRAVGFFAALTVLACFMASTGSQLIWDQLPLLQYLEFPWRFLSLAAVGTAFLCGLIFAALPRGRGSLANGLMALMLAAILVLNLPNAAPRSMSTVQESRYSRQAIAAGGVSHTTAGEYVPIWVTEQPTAPAREPLSFLSGRGTASVGKTLPTEREFAVTVTEDARLRLNTFYFPGWTLYIDGAERPVRYDNPQGVMEFSLARGQHTVRFVFADTPVRVAATYVSIFTLLLLLATPWLARLLAARASLLSTLRGSLADLARSSD